MFKNPFLFLRKLFHVFSNVVLASGMLFLIVVMVLLSPFVLYLIEPLRMQWKYANNFERTCEKRADPVRVKVGNMLFSLPADLFKPKNLNRCYGGIYYGSHRGCVYGQKRKSFIDEKTGHAVEGFCQKKTDPPFQVWRLFFLDTDGFVLNLTADQKPNLVYRIHDLRFYDNEYSSIRGHCLRLNGNPMNTFNNATLFSNPISVIGDYTSPFVKFSVLFGNKILLTSSISTKSVPYEYLPSFFSELENKLEGYIVKQPFSFGFNVCSKFDKEE